MHRELLMETGGDKLRVKPRKSWFSNVSEVTTSLPGGST
jgi:hypothetical protein